MIYNNKTYAKKYTQIYKSYTRITYVYLAINRVCFVKKNVHTELLLDRNNVHNMPANIAMVIIKRLGNVKCMLNNVK